MGVQQLCNSRCHKYLRFNSSYRQLLGSGLETALSSSGSIAATVGNYFAQVTKQLRTTYLRFYSSQATTSLRSRNSFASTYLWFYRSQATTSLRSRNSFASTYLRFYSSQASNSLRSRNSFASTVQYLPQVLQQLGNFFAEVLKQLQALKQIRNCIHQFILCNYAQCSAHLMHTSSQATSLLCQSSCCISVVAVSLNLLYLRFYINYRYFSQQIQRQHLGTIATRAGNSLTFDKFKN